MSQVADLRIGAPGIAPEWITSRVRKREVRLGHRLLGHVWGLPDGQWATWARGPRFVTAEEAAEHLKAEAAASCRLDRNETQTVEVEP